MLNSNLSDEQQIIERIRINDRTVLREIFLRYEKMFYSYIQKHGGNEADAEDILQETIIVLWQNVNSGKFTLTSRLSTYLMGIAKNKWLAEIRKRKRVVHKEYDNYLQDDNPSTLERLLTEERIHLVQKALDAIQPLCKDLLLLFYFEEKSMDQIAKIMNFANTDVVKSKKYQCKKALEECLQVYLTKMEGEAQ
jgi:RNA polymerase sigma factor (sigma-70 family)